MALDVGPGDEVVVPTFTFFATAGVVTRLGARPVFVDVDPVDCCIDPGALAKAVNSRTKAVIPVHLFGQSADLDGVREVSGTIPILEDCAQSWGADYRGTMTGSIGLMGAFSFFPSKNLGGFGDGGLGPVLPPCVRFRGTHSQGVFDGFRTAAGFAPGGLRSLKRLSPPTRPGLSRLPY